MQIHAVGGGPAGLYFALLMKLADARHEVTVLEREQPGIIRGWGVTFWDDLLESMREGDPVSAQSIGAAAVGWGGLRVDVRGSVVEQPGPAGHSIDRSVLVQILSERARELGVRVEHGRSADPTELASRADLVIASDGVGSRFRAAHAARLGTSARQGRNQFVWLATPAIFETFRFAFVELEAGWICAYAYAYSETSSTFVVECPPETWDRLGFAHLDAAASLRLLAEIFEAQLDAHPLHSKPGHGTGLPWARFTTVQNKTWHVGNVALMGDAAHTTHYSIGFGTKLALEDALTLSEELGRTALPSALEAYQDRRIRELRAAQRDARYSMRWFEKADRYLPYDCDDFASMLFHRRSALFAVVPPAALVRARGLLQDQAALRSAWSTVASKLAVR